MSGMNPSQAYRDRAREAGVPEHAIDLALSLVLPQTELSPSNRDGGAPVGRYGGLPSLPEGMEWDNGLDLVATVDCAALPPDGCHLPLPREGHLLFFTDRTDPDCQTSGQVSDSVVYVPAGTPTTERALPEDGSALPVIEARPLYARVVPSLPTSADDAVLSDPETARLYEEYQLEDHGHRTVEWEDGIILGGYAYSPQDPPIMDSSPEDEKGGWVLLAQAQLDMPEDPGIVACPFWIIQRDELRARNFAAAEMVMWSYH